MTPQQDSRNYWQVLAAGVALTLVGLGAAHQMEVHGHAITGMNNQVVWGLPHVFAIFLIVSASGVLNVASIGSVFGETIYKRRAPLSGLLSLALLAGGLMVLMLDLGRPDRVIVAATHYNFRSVFAWNVFLYSGMAAIIGLYLWTLMERRLNPLSKPAGLAALVWRFVLTTGTGSIFGFLVARQAYQSALLAPMFIVLSFGWGLAVFLVVQSSMFAWNNKTLPPEVQSRMARLLGVFLAASLYLVVVYHLTNLYFARQAGFETFILLGQRGGQGMAWLFWMGYVFFGVLVPLLLLYIPALGRDVHMLMASALVVLGAFAWLYVFIIGGQLYPLDIFPGYEVRSSFGDGQAAQYAPSWPELLLGLGGVGAAFTLTTIGVRVLNFLPQDDFAPEAQA
jgi:molybdopterin-containing oxidoreductase family membrane subunit